MSVGRSNWSIPIIYPDEEDASSILAAAVDTSFAATADDAAQVAASLSPSDAVSRTVNKRSKVVLPYATCWTPEGFVCPNCKKIYNARKNLARHVNLECGKEPQYACRYCDYKNYRRNEIKKHARNKHNSWNY